MWPATRQIPIPVLTQNYLANHRNTGGFGAPSCRHHYFVSRNWRLELLESIKSSGGKHSTCWCTCCFNRQVSYCQTNNCEYAYNTKVLLNVRNMVVSVAPDRNGFLLFYTSLEGTDSGGQRVFGPNASCRLTDQLPFSDIVHAYLDGCLSRVQLYFVFRCFNFHVEKEFYV